MEAFVLIMMWVLPFAFLLILGLALMMGLAMEIGKQKETSVYMPQCDIRDEAVRDVA